MSKQIFIYKKTVIKRYASGRGFEILTHRNIFEERKNQRAPPAAASDYTEQEIVSYDDGWPESDEPVFDF